MMADTAHTATPWKVGAYGGVYPDNGKETAAIACSSTKSGFLPNYKNNEAHIVKCVNAHDELVNALATLLKLNDDSGPFGGELYQDRVDRAWEKARSVVAKARGETHA